MKPLYALFLILFFFSCSLERAMQRATSTEERAVETQNRLKEKYPELVAEKFAEWFPVQEKKTIIRDTVFVPALVQAEPLPVAEPSPSPAATIPVKSSRPAVACPDLSYYTSTVLALRRQVQESAAALETAKNRFSRVQQALFREQEAHQSAKAAAEKAQKLKSAWKWFSLFLGLVIAWFILGKIFRFV